MVLFNYSTKELTAKVVYYGPGLCGKTTNLQWIHEKVPIKNKGKMLSLATETDRTLFFDFLPIEIGTIRGMKTRIQLYTVPGQVFYNATRRMVLKGADCVVFVCDSQEPMLDACIESFENLRQNMEANEIDIDEIPMVMQYNKRDLPNALPIEILNERMNPRGHPFFEAVALKGIGVEETLKGVTKLVFKSLSGKYGAPEPASAAAAKTPTAPVAPPPRPMSPSATIPPGTRIMVPRSPNEMLDGLDLTPAAISLDDVDSLDPYPSRGAKGPATKGRAMFDPDEEEAPAAPLELAPEPAREQFDEISLDSEPLPALEPEAEPESLDGPTLAPLAFDNDPLPSLEPEAEPESFDDPPPAPIAFDMSLPDDVSPAAAESVAETAAVTIDVARGQTEVSLPIELNLAPGVRRVEIALRLTLNIRG